MKIKDFHIPDEVYEAYERQAEQFQGASGGSTTPEDLMRAQLERFKGVSSFSRIVVVDSENRDRLEQILKGGSLVSAKDLVEKVQFLAEIEIGSVKVDFSPGQLGQLKRFASRNGRSLEEVVRDVVNEMGWRFFDHLPG